MPTTAKIQDPYILYIDDERSMIELVHQTLKFFGYKVVAAMTGKQGLAMMRERKPDLLLLDLMMPDFNGWDIYRAVKSDAALADIPVIIITARTPDAGHTVLDDLPPADAYIIKPFDIEDLVHAVQKLV